MILSKTLELSFEQLNATQLRLVAIMFVMYFGAMRAEEALNLLMEHVLISASGNLKVTLSKGKCNQFKRLHNVFLVPAVEAQALCPVQVIIHWYNQVLSLGGLKYLFPNLRGYCTIIQDCQISYSNLRGQWLRLLERTGLPAEETKDFGLHLLRISVATNALYRCGELEIQHLGRWQLSNMARHYVRLDEETQARSGLVLLGQLMAM